MANTSTVTTPIPTSIEYTEDIASRVLSNPLLTIFYDLARKILKESTRKKKDIPCRTCWLRFSKSGMVYHKQHTCLEALQFRSNILASEHYISTNLPTIYSPNNSQETLACHCTMHIEDNTCTTFVPYFCNTHYVCTDCVYRHNHETMSSIVMLCPSCVPTPVDTSQPMFTIPRRTNDCGLLMINAIIHHYRLTTTFTIRNYITHEDMRLALRLSSLDRYRSGMMYEYYHVMYALETLHFCTIPIVDLSHHCVYFIDQLVALIVVGNNHFYTYLRRHNNKWGLFDSMYGMMENPMFSDVEISCLVLSLASHTSTHTVSGIINTQSCTFYTHPNTCTRQATILCTSNQHLICDLCNTTCGEQVAHAKQCNVPVLPCYCQTLCNNSY